MSHQNTISREDAYAIRVARYMLARGASPEHALGTAASYLASARERAEDAARLADLAGRCTSPDPAYAAFERDGGAR